MQNNMKNIYLYDFYVLLFYEIKYFLDNYSVISQF